MPKKSSLMRLGRTNAFEEKISAAMFGRLSEKERKAIDFVVKNKTPVLFLGGMRTGKTYFTKILREMGVLAFAPEDISIIELGVKSEAYEVSKNDGGYPLLFEKIRLVKLV
jgi:predicted AAA+ superfamily ATPase